MSFYNSIHEKGERLAQSVSKARTQTESVYLIVKKIGRGTPSEISKLYDVEHSPAPLTSIRRALTDLTKEGRLVKTDSMRAGLYGKDEHVWKMPEPKQMSINDLIKE